MPVDKESTKITIENEYGTYTVSVPKKDMTLLDVKDLLVRPVLFAAGYGSKSIEEFIP